MVCGMTPLARQLEAILRKQRPVSSEEFWAQVEAFKDKPEETTQASSSKTADSMPGRQLAASLPQANS